MAKSVATKKHAKGGNRPRERTAWDRFWLWAKVNEKLMWVGLLLLIAPAFAFTGGVSSYLERQGRGYSVMQMFGEEIYNTDLEEANRLIGTMQSLRGGQIFGEQGLGQVDFLLLEREAQRRGIVVSDEELGQAIRRIYQVRKAQEDFWKYQEQNPSVNGSPPDYTIFTERFKKLSEDDAWDGEDWVRMLENIDRGSRGLGTVSSHPKIFQSALRRYMKAEKLVGYVRSSVQVTEEEIFREFQRKERFSKITFCAIEPDEATRKKAAEGVTEDDLRSQFRDTADSFKATFIGKLRVDYLYVPYEAFEKDVTLTDADILAEYNNTRGAKFRRGLVTDDGSFSLRTEEEEKERDGQFFKPIEEVKSEVVEALTEKRKKALARKFFSGDIRRRVFPRPESQDDRAMDGEKPDLPAAVSFDDLVKEHPVLETGRTPFMTQWEAPKALGTYDSSQIKAAFSSLSRNSRETDSANFVPVRVPRSVVEVNDGSGLVLYNDLRVLARGDEPQFEDFAAEVREEVVKRRALDLLKEKVDGVAAAIRSGQSTIAVAAAEFGATPHTTAFLKSTDGIDLPLEEEADPAEKAKNDGSAEDDVSRPKTERLPGSRTVMEDALLIDEKGDGGTVVVRDGANGVFYVIRLDDTLDPDPRNYEKNRKIHLRGLVGDRQRSYFLEWRRELQDRAEMKYVTYGTAQE